MGKTILEVIVGSTLHGTKVADGLEDLDITAVIVEDAHKFVGFDTVDTWTKRSKPMGVRSEAGDTDWVGDGLRKYLSLALKGNPSILLALFAPPTYTRVITPEGEALQALAPDIVSKAAYAPFRGYLLQQHERLLGLRGQRNVTRPELVEAYGFDTKYAACALRLGLQGKELLSTGRLSLPMQREDRELCVKVRTGGFTLKEVGALIQDTERQMAEAYATSTLPEHPNKAKVEKWMLDTYISYWSVK